MEIKAPLVITPRLLPGLYIGKAWISIEDLGRFGLDWRTCYKAWIDLPDGSEHEVDDLRSGCGGGDIYSGMSSLLAFLGAAAEAHEYCQRTGDSSDNENLFPEAINLWAAQHADDIMNYSWQIDQRLIAESKANAS